LALVTFWVSIRGAEILGDFIILHIFEKKGKITLGLEEGGGEKWYFA